MKKCGPNSDYIKDSHSLVHLPGTLQGTRCFQGAMKLVAKLSKCVCSASSKCSQESRKPNKNISGTRRYLTMGRNESVCYRN